MSGFDIGPPGKPDNLRASENQELHKSTQIKDSTDLHPISDRLFKAEKGAEGWHWISPMKLIGRFLKSIRDWFVKPDALAPVKRDLQSKLGIRFEQIPKNDQETLRKIADVDQVDNFTKLLGAKTESEAMQHIAEISGQVEEEDMGSVSGLLTRTVNRRFCSNRQFHNDTVGTGLAGINPRGGYGSQQLEGRGWHNPGWPGMWQHASWETPEGTQAGFKATRVLGLHDPISGKTEMGQVELDLGELTKEEAQVVMSALQKGARAIERRGQEADSDSDEEEPGVKIDPVASAVNGALYSIKDPRKQKHIASRVIKFIDDCDAKITELNQELQPGT
ncbi:MAG: hypothetical protein JKY15_02375 [Deltaproteobacteria bacterium]|nr:hypothetical protein [Deltaproteobacteria bacterium]